VSEHAAIIETGRAHLLSTIRPSAASSGRRQASSGRRHDTATVFCAIADLLEEVYEIDPLAYLDVRRRGGLSRTTAPGRS